MLDLDTLIEGEDVPDNSWVAIYCRASSYNKEIDQLREDAIVLAEGKKFFSVNVLIFKNSPRRSRKWLVRRLNSNT